jgi:Leucine-rich repeat (LRR) protein
MKALEELIAKYCRIDDNGLNEIGKMKSLRILDLEGNSMTNDGIHHIANLTQLRSLNLYNCESLTLLDFSILKLEELEVLSFSCDVYADEALDAMKNIKQIYQCCYAYHRQLLVKESATVYYQQARNDHIRMDLLPVSLTSLHLYSIFPSVIDISSLSRLCNLKTLDLGMDINYLDFSKLIDQIVKLKKLQNLTLPENFVLTEDFVKLESLELKSLTISNTINYGGYDSMYFLNSISTLTYLDFSYVNDLSLRCIIYLPQLRHLNLKSCSFVDVQYLSYLTTLKNLNLSETLNTSKIIPHIKNLTLLKTLNLNHCKNISTKEMKIIGTLTSLKVLNLGFCSKINDDDMILIKQLINLKRLDISSCNKIKNDGFVLIKEFKRLKYLALHNCHITEECIDELLKHLEYLYHCGINQCWEISVKRRQALDSMYKGIVYPHYYVRDIFKHNAKN